MKKIIAGIQLIIILILLTSFSQPVCAAEKESSNILIIYSQDFTFAWVKALQRSISSALQPDNIKFYNEHVNEKIVNKGALSNQAFNSLQAKYKDIKFDCVIIADNYEHSVMGDYYKKVAPKTPIVFVGVNEYANNIPKADMHKDIVQNKYMDNLVEAILSLDNKDELIFISTRSFKSIAEINSVQKIINDDYKNLNCLVKSDKNLYEVLDKLLNLKQARWFTQGNISQAKGLVLTDEEFTKVFATLHFPITLSKSLKKSLFESCYESESHIERMTQLTKMLGQAMGLQLEQIAKLELLGCMHDIGKIGIDNRILTKPGKLSADEWLEMKKHTSIGYRIAVAAPDLKPIAQAILCHHERWDGQGYPLGLQGENIPLLSRILSVADAYDAMTSNRPYRKAMPKEAAIAEIVRCSGTQFDPEVVKVFLKVIPEFS